MARKATSCIPSIRSCNVESGFALIEILVAIVVTMLAFAAAGTLLAATQRFSQTQILRIETVQALRSTLDTMVRDLRLGGACLPTTGDFSPIDGTSTVTSGLNTDSITTRTGLVRPNLTCIYSDLATAAASGATSLTVLSSSGFQVGMGAYIYNQQTGTGQDFNITSISGNVIGSDASMTQAYPNTVGSAATVYASEKRKYAIDSTSNPSLPVLTVTINNGTAVPFASGIEALNIQYRLLRNCPPCDTVDLPATAEWPLVNEMVFSITARSRTKDLTGNYYRRSSSMIAKPRNLIPVG